MLDSFLQKSNFTGPRKRNNDWPLISSHFPSMNFSAVVISLACFCLLHADAQNSTQNEAHPFHGPLAAVIGVMGIMLSIVILVIAYAKFCHRHPFDRLNGRDVEFQGSRASGIDKATIDRIPIFRFSSLRGSKRGLECAVCLSTFEDIEILRLLPKCKHAFHRNCIDEWLESHSSCPLCRQRFDAQDVTTFTFSSSLRFSQTPSNLTDDLGLELFIQREEELDPGPSRFSIGGSFRLFDKSKTKENPLRDRTQQQQLHKLKHRIIVSDVVVKQRWSDVNSSDLLSLNSDMLNLTSSQRFSFSSLGSRSARFSTRLPMSDDLLKIKEDMEKRMCESKFSKMQRSSSVSTSSEAYNQARLDEKRSMSEITSNVSRFRDFGGGRNKVKESPQTTAKEERRRGLWLPIARRTLQRFAGTEKTHTSSNV